MKKQFIAGLILSASLTSVYAASVTLHCRGIDVVVTPDQGVSFGKQYFSVQNGSAEFYEDGVLLKKDKQHELFIHRYSGSIIRVDTKEVVSQCVPTGKVESM